MPKSAAYANIVLDYVYGGSNPTRPTGRYLSLHTADPGITGANEASGAGYARLALTFGAAASQQTKNSSAVSMTPTVALGTLTHLGIWDALTGGTLIAAAPLTASIPHTANLTLTAAANSIVATEA